MTYRRAAIYLAHWTPDNRGDAHKDHVRGIAHVDDGAGRVESLCHLWRGGEHAGARLGGEKCAKRQDSDGNVLPTRRQPVVERVVDRVRLVIAAGSPADGIGRIEAIRAGHVRGRSVYLGRRRRGNLGVSSAGLAAFRLAV